MKAHEKIDQEIVRTTATPRETDLMDGQQLRNYHRKRRRDKKKN